MNNTFFVSDTHFGHANIIKYSNRPFKDVADMNAQMVDNWNKIVKPGDTVWHLGDVAFMPFSDFNPLLHSTNGNWNIILGNHDKLITQNVREFIREGKIQSVQSYKELKIAGQNIVLFHYGQRVWNRSHHGAIMLYGHSHGSLPPFGRSVDVGVDCKEITPEYRPVHLDEVLEYMSKRTGQTVDHHLMDD